MNEILKIENLSKSYNGLPVVRNVSFSVRKGSVTALIGENGAGKTTLFNLISRFDKHDKGRIYFQGKEISNLSAIERSKIGIERLFQNPRVFKNMSVTDNLMACIHEHPGENIVNYILKPNLIRGTERKNLKKAIQIIDMLHLQNYAQEKAGSLSHGQKKLLSLGMLLMNNAGLILLDEPFSGLNPSMTGKIIDIVKGLNKEGKTFVIIEHNIKKVLSVSSHVLRMREGEIIEDRLVN
jgi:branched-chain amino acid transport system ATP-binding protein